MVEIRRYTYETQRNYFIKFDNRFARLRVCSPHIMIVPPNYFSSVEVPIIKWQHASPTNAYEVLDYIKNIPTKKYFNGDINGFQ